MEQLPENWAIKATNNKEAKIIADYATPLAIEEGCSSWTNQDALDYYMRMVGDKYNYGCLSKESNSMIGFEIISFSDFSRLVLNKNVEPTYEIY